MSTRCQKEMKSLSLIAISALAVSCQIQSSPKGVAEDPYVPHLRVVEENPFTGKQGIAYRFSHEQLARMARTKLDTKRFVSYVEKRWPIQRLQGHCTATNIWLDLYQNLVAQNCQLETDIHMGEATGFDRIWVYVDQDDGGSTYFGEVGTKWHRWTYSLNTQRGSNHWAIIEQLPNDFMDSAKYDTDYRK